MNQPGYFISLSANVILPLFSAFSFLMIGVPYWQIRYSQLALPNALYGTGLLILLLCALSVSSLGFARTRNILLCTGMVCPAVVLSRIVVEVLSDPQTHNLWPFELLIAVIVGFGVAGIGVGIGSLARRLIVKLTAATNG